jgi:hypothetical protein
MFTVFELTEEGDAVFVAEYATEEAALLHATELNDPRVEHHFGWGAVILV